MLQRRYPHRDAGQIAAPVFGVGGFLAGTILGFLLWHSTYAVLYVVLWAGLSALIAFLVFATEGQARPPSVTQAAIADGVVSGATGGTIATLVCVLLQGGAGTGTGPALSSIFLTGLAGFVGGLVAGGLLGWIALLVGGEDRFARRPQRAVRSRSRQAAGRRKRR